MIVRLEELTKGLAHELLGDPGVDVASIEYDSRRVRPGCLFVAVPGAEMDGHRFCASALDQGASALLVEHVPDDVRARLGTGEHGFGIARVGDTRQALAEVAARFYDRPGDAMTLIGVTGTNGKTSTVRMLYSILERAGRGVGSLGTIATRFADVDEPSRMTTPESLDLQRTLRRMRDADVDTCVLEVSSHSLVQSRVRSLRFAVAVFTHLSQDHLDFHGSMDRYAEAKAQLFGAPYLSGSGTAVLNVADPHSEELAARARAAGGDVLTFGRGADSGAHVRSVDESISLSGSLVRVEGPARTLDIALPLPGDFQVENALAAIAAAHALGIEPEAITEGLRTCPPVPGRLERVGTGDPVVLVDYAHTPDALDRVLARVRPHVSGRLICVFGCGGDRDRTKRAPMAEAACRHAEHVVATSDNPRTEAPEVILDDVRAGLGGSFDVIVDRREAIRTAIAQASPGDVVVIAGKGHEDYQVLGRERVPFDDRIEALEALRTLGIPT